MKHNPMFGIDLYKASHREQYPDNTTRVYSNFTARGSRIANIDCTVNFGLQAFLKDYCIDAFAEWFALDETEAVDAYVDMMVRVLGPNAPGGEHVRALHRLGYLPLRFCALPEGTLVPLRVPSFTVENTHDEFFWLVNYIESILSTSTWMAGTSATTAWHMRRMLDEAAARTGGAPEAVDWQMHDFSLRGMASIEAAAASGAGHLLSSTGTDSLPAIEWIDYLYPGDNGLVGGSVAATEHSVMCAGGELSERETFARLFTLYPTGILSVVSDTWDLWKVCTDILPSLKNQIMARDGKLVIRPDSGDPVDIICGIPGSYRSPEDRTPAEKGVAELLWETFGGTINAAGFKELDSHIGMIYGDSINYDRAVEMTRRLEAKGFASTNIVLGVGSYTYQYTTRDTFGSAMKATWAVVDGQARNLFKAPVTDGSNGVKKSATGRLAVRRDAFGKLILIEKATAEQEAASLLVPVWEDGKFLRTQSFADVRATLRAETERYNRARDLALVG